MVSGPDGPYATLQVRETLRGVVPGVVTLPVSGECDATFWPGREYLVYASDREGRMVADACSRTRPVTGARTDLAYLRSAARPSGGTLYGDVALVGFDEEPSARVRVFGQSGARRRTLFSEFNLREFEITVLPPGDYKLSVEGPAEIVEPPDAISISAGACVYTTVRLRRR
jgi:hypothetical protein